MNTTTATKELFIVEGKSAESTIRQAMNRATQEVFAVQGKILNAENMSDDKIHDNPVCAALFETLGCGVGNQCDATRLNFKRVILLTDPDVDGAHARALLALLFMKLLRPLVESRRVFAVIPPLWRLDAGSSQTGTGEAVNYAWTDDELQALRAGGAQPGSPGAPSVTRFRGVAQFNQRECSELCLDPQTRRQVLLSLG